MTFPDFNSAFVLVIITEAFLKMLSVFLFSPIKMCKGQYLCISIPDQMSVLMPSSPFRWFTAALPTKSFFQFSVSVQVRGDKSDETFMSVVLRKALHNDTKKLLRWQSSPVLCAERTLKVSAWTPLAGRFGVITPKPLLHRLTVRRASVTIDTHWAGFSVILNRGGSPRTNTGPLWMKEWKKEWKRMKKSRRGGFRCSHRLQ